MDAKGTHLLQNAEKRHREGVKEKKPVAFPDCKVFGIDSRVIFGDWKVIEPILKENAESIEDMVVKTTAAIPLCRCWIKNISMHGSSQGQSFEIRWKSVTMPLS